MVLQAERERTAAPPAVAASGGGVAGDSMVVSFWTIVSRVTGLLRLAAIAAVLGATYMGNTFQAANLVPNAVYEFLTGSLLVNVLVPHLVRHVRRSAHEDVERIAGGFLGIATTAFAVVTGILILLRPLLLRGFTLTVGDAHIAVAQRHVGSILLLFILPQIVLYAIAGTAGAVLNAKGRFALPAAAPAIENIGTIAVIVAAAVVFGTGVDVRHAPSSFVVFLGVGATAAVVLHAVLLTVGCHLEGIRLRPRLNIYDPDVRAVVRDLLPTLGQAGLNALRTMAALVVGNVVAGGVVAFQLALTFFYFPPALSAKSVGVAMLRRLSVIHDDGDHAEFRAEFGRGIALTAFVTIPASVAFFVLARPLVRGLSFGEMATTRSIGLAAMALIALAPGVIGESAYLLGTYASYARGDVRSPFRAAILRTSVVIGGMVLAVTFVHSSLVLFFLGVAVTAGNVVGSIDLARRSREWLPPLREVARSCGRAAAVSLLMVAAALPIYRIIDAVAHRPAEHAVAIILTGAIGFVVYVLFQRRIGSPELAMFTDALPFTRLHAPKLTSAIDFELGDTVVKVFDAPESAIFEYERIRTFAQAVEGHARLTAARPIELVTSPRTAVRMSRVDGVPLSEYLMSHDVDAQDIASVLHDGLATYTAATHEPYYDFHLRNALLDERTGRIGLIDFGIPDQHARGDTHASAIETSLGNLVGSTIFEAARPYQMRRMRPPTQMLDLVAAVVRSFHPDENREATWAGIERAARTTWEHCSTEGGSVRRLWYRTVGRLLALRAARAFGEISVVSSPSRETTIAVGGVLTAVALAPLALASPVKLIAALVGLAIVVAVALRPPVAAYILVFATPLAVGINRGSAIPLLRPHEALVALVGVTLGARALVGWARNGFPKTLRLPSLDVGIALLVLTGSILPVIWMLARGHDLSRDDFLYALVMWKYAATYLIVRSAVRSSDDVARCLWLSVAATALVAGVGVLQALKLFGVPGFLMHVYAPDGVSALVANNRATSTIGNSIAFADVMVIHLGIVIACIFRTRRRRALLVGLAALFSVAAFASGQTSGVIALVVAVATVAFLTRRVKEIAIAGAVVAMLALVALQPVIHQRLAHVDHRSGLPQSWMSRSDNLKKYILPELSSPANVALGVRPAARVPARESWRDWVYIESGWVWLLWTGGIPLAVAFVLFVVFGFRATVSNARKRAGPIGVAATGAVVGLAILAVLMPLDPHLTMRGMADVLFMLLALSTARIPERFVAAPARLVEAR